MNKTYGLRVIERRYILNPDTGFGIPEGSLIIPMIDSELNMSTIQHGRHQ
jgi:hypothetical protein